MSASTRRWQRQLMVVAVGATGMVVPLVSSVPASAATNLCGPVSDTVPPSVTGVTFSRSTVNLNSGSRTVTITVAAQDTSGNGTPSGVKAVAVRITGKLFADEVPLSRTSGTAADGTWSGSLVVPDTTTARTLALTLVTLHDAAGNYQGYSNGGGSGATSPTDVRLQTGWDTAIRVTGTPKSLPKPPKVRTAGTIKTFSFTPAAVNTTKAVKYVRVSATFTSPQPRTVDVIFSKPTGAVRGINVIGGLKRSAGGRWTGRVEVPRWTGTGTAKAQVEARYGANVTPYRRYITSGSLTLRHLKSQLKITSDRDTTRPVLRSLTISPTAIDTTTGAVTATVTATATDNKSGVASIEVGIETSRGTGGSPLGFYPHPGMGYETQGNADAQLVRSGTKWVGTVVFARCVPGGSWTVSAGLTDRAGNSRYDGPNTLAGDGLLSHVSVTATGDDTIAPSVSSATAAATGHTLTLDFDEGVKNVDTSTLSVYGEAPAASRFTDTADVTGIVCSNGTATVDCSGSGGLVTSAVLTVPSITAGSTFEVFANLGSVTTQLTDGAGNPLAWDQRATLAVGS